jgi:3-hydroxyisobutyrate dehydrogenase-like beta-hydroxyacid dehydrogenase
MKDDVGKNLLEKKIGFIGTGMMGDPMAQNLLRTGYKVMVYDVRREATKNVMALGAKLVQGPSEMGCCDIVFIMVNTGSQVENLLFGKQGIVQGFKGKQLLRLVIMSTVTPNLVKRIAHMIGSKNTAIVDAPVSGGIGAAQHGLLTFMVGGQEDIVASIKPYLQVMGKNIVYIGPLGSGLAIKLLNNILGITNLFLFPEVLRLGLKAGLDIKTMVEVFRVIGVLTSGTAIWVTWNHW